MLCQFRIRACADRTRATTDRVRRRLLERAIDAGARDLPHTRDARHAITASQGGRECLAHRLDLLWAKGRLLGDYFEQPLDTVAPDRRDDPELGKVSTD